MRGIGMIRGLTWPHHKAGESTVVPRSWLDRATQNLPGALLVLGIAAYVIGYSRSALANYHAFWIPSFDFGIFDQGVWLLSRFEEPFITTMGVHLFGDHASFILLLFVPVYWVWLSGEVLLYAQTFALASGAVPVFLLSRRLLNDWIALLAAVAYLLTPAVGWINAENFHPDSFEVPLLLFAVYFMVGRRWRLFLACVVLLLLVKEDVPLVTIPLGIYIALRYSRRVGLATVAVSAAWLVLAAFVILPHFSGVEAGGLDSWRIPFGGMWGLVETAIRSPWEVGGYAFTTEKLRYLFQLLTPLAFLPLMAPLSLVLVPAVSFHLLSTFWYQSSIEYHYTAPLVPILWAAAVLAIARIDRERLRAVAAVVLLGASVLSAYLWGPLDWSLRPTAVGDPHSAIANAAREAIALIPPEAVVSARSHCAAHLSHREQIYDFPNPWIATYYGNGSVDGQRLPAADEVEFVLVLRGELLETSLALLKQLPEEGFRPIFEKEGIMLLARDVGS